MIKPWKKISSRPLGDFRIFTIRTDICESPRTGRQHDFFVLNSPDWVNIIAVTPQQELVMVEQYRFGSETVELEIPGGMMDKTAADPVVAGLREFREETGYEGENARPLGKIFANPAILNNRCHMVVVENCRLQHAVQFDHAEDIVTRLVPIADIPKLVADEKIRHPLVVVALYYYELLRRGVKA